jgi:hypothetical protein
VSAVPLAVLLARLENELESLRLAIAATHYVKARDAQERASDLAKQMRESL